MKFIPCVAALVGAAVLAGSGCTKQKSTDVGARVKDAYEEAKTAVADAWTDAKSYTFEKRREFSASARSLTTKMDSEVEQMRASYSEAKASANRKKAMDELKSAQAELKAKVDALGHATASTWDSAKQEVVAAWDRCEAACRKARED